MTVKLETVDTFGTVKISDLVESKDNPRKTYDDQAFKDLVESIKEKGILTPLMVRRVKEKMQILAGSRRFRASKELKLETIPVKVIEANDKTAFELMLIENLQREDVHPMDEAKAFMTLFGNLGREGTANDSKPYHAIAQKTGKTASYVMRNIKLTDLIPDAMTYFYDNVITVKHALLICRLSEKDQEKILLDKIRTWGVTHATPYPEWKAWVDNMTTKYLGKAPFDLNDSELFEPAGTCSSCPKNTSVNTLLFDDMDEDALCTDRECFKTKTRKHLSRERQKLKDNGNYFIDGGFDGYDGKVKIKERQYDIMKKKDCKNPLMILIRSHDIRYGNEKKSLVGTTVYIDNPFKVEEGKTIVEVVSQKPDWEKEQAKEERKKNRRHFNEANMAMMAVRGAGKKLVENSEKRSLIESMLVTTQPDHKRILGFALEVSILKDYKTVIDAIGWNKYHESDYDPDKNDILIEEIIEIAMNEYTSERFCTLISGVKESLNWSDDKGANWNKLLEVGKVDEKKMTKALAKQSLAYAKTIE